MWSLLVIPILAASPAAPGMACQELASRCQTGTLLFSQGDCLAVKIFSGSRFTHCAAVVLEEGMPVVYDAMNGHGVRKTALGEYLRQQTPSELLVVSPIPPFTADEAKAFREHLQGQLGRPYAIKHHLTGQRSKGVHCAEYLTDALMAAGKIEADKPPRVSPGSLYEGLTTHGLYTDERSFSLTATDEPPVSEEASWCRRAWNATCQCTLNCCRKMSRWFLCREK